ncbi:hypothetical protein [Lacticaseibacillus zhaodongensis]|uniref:hypothetical protein n=1 Tax=Lacticaseibacillus zhaodongensis TaxID=2668065 RepID=UPI0012D36BED|nr:hypothetical protein [Lacticaseibacillus zhaodongensis]
MVESFLIAVDVALAVVIAYNLYWQSQIELQANYAYWQMIWGVVIAVWMATTGIHSMPYIVFLALFVLLNVSAGVGGIGTSRIVGNGFFSRFLSYKHFAGVTLTPIKAPGGRDLVVAIFALEPRRYIRLTFRQPLEQIIVSLQQRLPESVPVTIQKIN